MKKLARLFNIFLIASLLAGAAWTIPPVSPAYALTWTNRTTADGLGNNWVFDVHASGSNVYAATNGGGLSISTDGGASFANKTITDGLGSNFVRGVYVSGSNVYAATAGGLSISTNGGASFVNRTTTDGLGSNTVDGVHASGSTVYAATQNGLSISTNDGASFSNKTTAHGLGSNIVTDVHVNGSTVYAATTGGLSISTNDGASFSNKTTADGLGDNEVYDVHVSGSTVYAATFGGLSISTDGGVSFVNRTTADGLGTNWVYGVFASGSTVYVATNGGGLSISTNGGVSFSTDTTVNGLGSNFVRDIHVSGSTVYAATEGGLSYVSITPTFADVPFGGFAWAHIEAIYSAGITGGCSTLPLNYCPGGQVTRAQMAVFLLKGIHGSSYTPPAATGTVFNDVPMGSFAAAFIEAFSTAGITGGCGNGNYCPSGLVTRSQMAVFLLKAKHGSSYIPPVASGTMFNDVPSNAFAAVWIEQLATEGITGGCGSGNYCPNNPVTRAQMAVFLQKTFNLPLP